jgi:hypothetical protein
MPTKDEMYKFQQEIESLVEGTSYNYMEAIIEYCNMTGMEIELASTLVNKELKAKLALVAEELNMIPKSSRLPI